MTLAELLIDLGSRIGSDPEVDNTKMTTWLNQALLAFCNTSDYHWLEKASTTSTIASQERYALPSDCKRMIEFKIDGNRYKYVRFEQRDMYPDSQKIYSVLNDQIYVQPIPTTTGSSNINMAYVLRPTKMTADSDSPSDSDIANLPEVYHEALVIYAFAIYNTYDEEHGEAESLMGSKTSPRPGTFNWYVLEAMKEEKQRKKGQRDRMLSTSEYYGYHRPNTTSTTNTVLGN